MNVERATGFF